MDFLIQFVDILSGGGDDKKLDSRQIRRQELHILIMTAPDDQPATFFRYIPVSPRDEAWGLVVTTAGIVKIEAGMAYPPPGHPKAYTFSWKRGRVLDEYQLHFIPRGGGVLESEPSGENAIEAGNFFMLFPGVRHRYRPHAETGWDEFWVGFKGSQADELVKRGFFTEARPVFRPRMERRAHEMFSEILTQLRSEPAGFMPVISATTSLMLARLHASTQQQHAESRGDKVIRRAKDVLRSRLEQTVDMESLAGELGVSYSWLRRTFREVTGLPPYQYHLQLRLGHAMDLLAGSHCTVKEAASRSGFDDEHYFSRLFKKKTGKSPKAWQQRARGG